MPSRVNHQRRKMSVPTIARMEGVAEKKVLDWIRSGELRAINIARRPDGRPRYAIDIDDLAAFERSRLVVPSGGDNAPRLRRRAAVDVKQFV